MGEMADLWDKFFGNKFSKEPEVNKYLLQLNSDIEGWIKNCKELQDALRETQELMISYFNYYASEFKISTDPPDTDYLERLEKNERLLSWPISATPQT